jgi:signal transduction histidine kinase
MAPSGWLVPIYFAYGLAFFALGLVVFMESLRDAASIELPRLFRLLGVFALLHALHEWLEIVPSQGEGGVVDPILLEWVRSGTLVLSFSMLWLYGLGMYRAARPNATFIARFGRFTLPPYAALVLLDVAFSLGAGRIDALHAFSGLTRYLFAVPSAALAAIGIWAAGAKAAREDMKPLASYLRRRALLFGAYSLSQFFVPTMDTMLARIFSAANFYAVTEVPIQVVRTVIAFGMTWYLFREVLFLEERRKAEKERVQAERLRALEAAEELRGKLLNHTIQAQEDERARISRELHDEVAQVLTALSLDLGTLKTLLPKNKRAEEVLQRLQNLAKRLSHGMHDLVRSLRPALLDELGLEAALRSLVEREWNPRGISVRVEVEGVRARLDGAIETTIFRVAQEAITNVQRHAKARSAVIRMEYSNRGIRLVVSDDGVGFDPLREPAASKGLGLAGMRERVEALGGEFSLKSEPGRGTRVEIDIPDGERRGG